MDTNKILSQILLVIMRDHFGMQKEERRRINYSKCFCGYFMEVFAGDIAAKTRDVDQEWYNENFVISHRASDYLT